MRVVDADDISAWIYSRAGADDEDAQHPVALVKPCGLRLVRSDMHGPGRGKLEGTVIRVGRRIEGTALLWVVAHELAEFAIRECDYRGEDAERLADAGAAAIVMPRRAFLKHLRTASLAEMARFYELSCTAISLRYGETTGRPVAVIAPTHVHLRGEPIEWGDLPGLAKAKLPPEGVERVRLADNKRRVRLIVK